VLVPVQFREMQRVKYLTAATAAVTLSLAFVGCGSDNKSDNNTTSTSTSTPGARPNKTVADYIAEKHITEPPSIAAIRARPSICRYQRVGRSSTKSRGAL